MSEMLQSGFGIPSEERRKKGPVACFECFEEIPCNPCSTACPRGAVTVGDAITNLPHLDEDKCNGCGLCITHCPGLAAFVVDESGGDTAKVSFPFEYVPLPETGDRVPCTDREGKIVCEGTVVKVLSSPAFDHTAVVTVQVPAEFSMTVRGLKIAYENPAEPQPVISSKPEDEDDVYVCRCEEVTRGEIRAAVRAGADSIRAVKLMTHAGMGICQGMTCRRNIEKILREEGVTPADPDADKRRFPVRPVGIDTLSSLTEEVSDE